MRGRPGERPGHDPEGRASGPPGEPQSEGAVGFRARSFLTAALSRFGDGPPRCKRGRERRLVAFVAARRLAGYPFIWTDTARSGTELSQLGWNSRAAPVDEPPAKARGAAERRERRERRGVAAEQERGRRDGAERSEAPGRGGAGDAEYAAAKPRRSRRTSGGGGRGEAVPSAGWREVAVALEADEGACHR